VIEPAVYVYGVVSGAGPEVQGTGVAAAAPVRSVAGDGFAAVVSDVPAGWRAANRNDLQAHDRVLNQLVGESNVIPMRFGVVMASDEEVRERLLAHRSSELGALFERLGGRVQMSVKAYYVGEALLREVLRRHPQLKRRSEAVERQPLPTSQPERIALGRDVAAAVEEQRALDQELLLTPLSEPADDVRVEAPAADRQALNLHLLVRRERRTQLDAVVTRLSTEHGDRFALRYVGPLPPYSFTDLQWDS
jgi:hypothetical protein